MTDEHFSPSPSSPPPPTEADYEAIAAAVMETVRGRWFLGEFAKRNRNADTELILKRIDRVELLVRAPASVSSAERVRIDLVEMAKAIAQTRREIAAIKPDSDAKGTLSEASEELDSIVQATERATSDILAAAEQIQEIGWTLRERGAESAICDSLDQRATDIYSACSFQDLTGQRTRKVVDVLQFLEDRIRAMIEIWGGAVPEQDGAPAAVAPHVGADRTVPHLEQQDIDRMMPSAPPAVPAAVVTARPAEAAASVETVMMPVAAVVGATALALDLTPMEVARQPEPAPAPAPAPEPAPVHQPEPAPESDAQPEAVPQSTAQPEPIAAPQAEPAAETEAVATPSEPSTDPAAVLKRILAIIRAPSEPVARPVTTDDATAAAAANRPAELDAAEPPAAPRAPPEVETQSGAAGALPVAAATAVVDLSASDAAVEIAAASPPNDVGSAQLQDPAQTTAPQAAIDDEVADDILMPLPGPLTVDQAVDEMLKAPGRIDVAAAPEPKALESKAPTEEEPPTATSAPVAGEVEPAVAAGSSRPFVIEVPEFTVARPPAPEQVRLEPESATPAETAAAPEITAAPIAEAATSERPARLGEMRAAPMHPEPPPPRAASEPPPPADAVAAPPTPPAEIAAVPPPPRHPALAAIAALSDDEKIALFS